MKDYLSEVYELFPRRRNDAEKAKLFEYVSLELGQERAAVEEIDKNKTGSYESRKDVCSQTHKCQRTSEGNSRS